MQHGETLQDSLLNMSITIFFHRYYIFGNLPQYPVSELIKAVKGL